MIQSSDLKNALAQLTAASDPLAHERWVAGMNGHCDAFAVALCDELTARAVPAALVLIARVRTLECNGEPVETVPFSHVVVEALEDTWDIEGPGALDRRWDDWEPEAGFEDEFEATDVTRAALEAARRADAGRGVCAEKVTWFSAALATVLPPLVPSSSPARRKP